MDGRIESEIKIMSPKVSERMEGKGFLTNYFEGDMTSQISHFRVRYVTTYFTFSGNWGEESGIFQLTATYTVLLRKLPLIIH